MLPSRGNNSYCFGLCYCLSLSKLALPAPCPLTLFIQCLVLCLYCWKQSSMFHWNQLLTLCYWEDSESWGTYHQSNANDWYSSKCVDLSAQTCCLISPEQAEQETPKWHQNLWINMLFLIVESVPVHVQKTNKNWGLHFWCKASSLLFIHITVFFIKHIVYTCKISTVNIWKGQ